MKVMDKKRWAKLCANRFLGDGEDFNHFGGTFPPSEAALDDDIVDGLKIRKALERFGQTLVAQYDKTGRGSRIIGVNLHSISFSFITVPEHTARAD